MTKPDPLAGTFQSLAILTAYALTVEMEKRLGVHVPDADSLTVKDATQIWLVSAEANGCDRGTIKSYREIANGHIIPLVGAKKLTRLTAPEIVTFKDALLQTRSRAMTAKAIRHLSMILSEAMRRGLVGQNVARGITVKRPREDGKRQRLAKRAEIPSKEHLKRLLDAAERLGNDDPRLPILLPVVMLAGLRASELRAFSWAHANLGTSASLTVTQRADRWNDIGPPKSDAGYRTIPIGPALTHRLKEWKLRCPPSPLNLVFPATRRDRRWSNDRAALDYGPIKQSAFSSLFLKVQVSAGLAIDTGRKDAKGQTVWKSRYGWHDLRHVAASNWLNDGIDLKRLQTWVGHENIQLTIDVYGHLIADAKKDAAFAAAAEASLLA